MTADPLAIFDADMALLGAGRRGGVIERDAQQPAAGALDVDELVAQAGERALDQREQRRGPRGNALRSRRRPGS